MKAQECQNCHLEQVQPFVPNAIIRKMLSPVSLHPWLVRCCRSLPPPPLPTNKARATSLQLVQHINCVRAVQVQLLRSASPSDVLHNVVRICGADDWDLRCEPLLERLRGEVAVRCKPPCHCCADVDLLLRVGVVGCGSEDNVAFVDGDVLLG